jgi:ribonuclease Z
MLWRSVFLVPAMVAVLAGISSGPVSAAPCMKITLTGTQGGPPVFRGQAGAGTLVRYGDDTNNCSAVFLQFDTGRGTTQQLSKLRVPVGKLNAIFYTHMHSDHTEGLADMMQLRWHFISKGPNVDIVCAQPSRSAAGHTMDCRKFAQHIGDAFIHSGEMAQRLAENKKRRPEGPSALLNVKEFALSNKPGVVWKSGDVTVKAIKSRHVAGHASYRVDTPAGSVVVGGDAGNDSPKPPRATSVSAQVESLSKGADILVHSTIHPVMGPGKGSGFPPPIFFRQSTAADLGGLAKRAGVKTLMLTHLIPPLGAAKQGPYPIPGGALDKAAYQNAATESGYRGHVVVGHDLATIQLPRK